MEVLKDVIMKMDPKEARYHMKRCVDAGLWVASDSSAFEDDGIAQENANASKREDDDGKEAAK